MNRLTPPSLPSLPHLRGVQQRHSVLDLSSIPALPPQAPPTDDNGLAQSSPTSRALVTGSTNVGSRVPGRRAVASKRKPGPPMRTTGGVDAVIGIPAPVSFLPEGAVPSSLRQELPFPLISPTRPSPEATPGVSAAPSGELNTAVVEPVSPDFESGTILAPAEFPQEEVKKNEPVVYVVSKPFLKDSRSVFDPIVTHRATALFTPLFHRCIRFLQVISTEDPALEYRCPIRGFDVPCLDAALQADVDAAADELRSHLSNEAKRAIFQSVTELKSMYEAYLGTLSLLETTDQCLMRLMYEAQQGYRRTYLESSRKERHEVPSDQTLQPSDSIDSTNNSEMTSTLAPPNTVSPPSLEKLEYAWHQIQQLTKRQMDLCVHLEATVENALRVVLDTMNLLGAEHPDFIAPLSSLVAFVPNPFQASPMSDCECSTENKLLPTEVKAVENERSVSAQPDATEVSATTHLTKTPTPVTAVVHGSATCVTAEVARTVAPSLSETTGTEAPVVGHQVSEAEVAVRAKAVEIVKDPAVALPPPALRGQALTADKIELTVVDVPMATADTAEGVSQFFTETAQTPERIKVSMTTTNNLLSAAFRVPATAIEFTESGQEVSTPPLACFFTPTGPSDEAQVHWEPTAELVAAENANQGDEARAALEPIPEAIAPENSLPVSPSAPSAGSDQLT